MFRKKENRSYTPQAPHQVSNTAGNKGILILKGDKLISFLTQKPLKVSHLTLIKSWGL